MLTTGGSDSSLPTMTFSILTLVSLDRIERRSSATGNVAPSNKVINGISMQHFNRSHFHKRYLIVCAKVHQNLNRNNAPTSVPTIPTASSGGVFARKNFSCAPETGKSMQSPIGIRKLYVAGTGFCVFRAYLHPRSSV